MKAFTFFSLVLSVATGIVSAQSLQSVKDMIIANAKADNIDLTVLPCFDQAIADIQQIYANAPGQKRDFSRRQATTATAANIVDVHAHVGPAWYKALFPTIGGQAVPDWKLNDTFNFMATQGIQHSVLAFSVPGPNVWPGDQKKTIALARLMNEQAAAYGKVYPGVFNFYGQVPLPYTQDAITEAKYATQKLGAVGIWLQSNTEGKYLGDLTFKPFFQAVNSWSGRQLLYIHPSIPLLRVNGQLIDSNPTPYVTGKIEFYFETARTVMDLTLTQTIHNFTNINYLIPHVGGGFPAAIDRILKSYPTIYDSSLQIYCTRFWWDSAGPTYFHQVAGLLGYGIPKSQLLYGTDYPYAPLAVQPASFTAVKNRPDFTADEKTAIFRGNAVKLFDGKIKFN
ncbi:hypothetical protein CPB83DRAFT_895265 [Crepidotus variabilis]|uniref:Amidohydrolase-related domain-containing protein n=1 Tax=Crepidotus variabilis TaxID=179855 RepID=A0A9P6EEK1_9AGAR|nr:hypothetical protein CPB83DRAFT_895265 [Crepidotus variabilis]